MILNLKSYQMKKAIIAILIILGVTFSRPADLSARSPSETISAQYSYLQDNDIRFERFSVEQGLSQSTVTCILQDSHGYLWFGTRDGLNRFNGYEFEIFDHDPDNPNSLSDNVILAMLEDRDGMLWIGTENGGLNKLNPVIGEIVHYDLERDSIHAILEDKLGLIWIGTERGVVNIDRYTGAINQLEESLMGEAEIFVILEDREGLLWFGTDRGLVQYDPVQAAHTVYRYDPVDPTSLTNDTVLALYEDQNGELWVGTNAGVSILNRDEGDFTRYRHNPGVPHSLGGDMVSSIFEDSQGVLWFGTDNGLDRFDHRRGGFVHYSYDPGNPHSVSDNVILSLYEDLEGGLWVGTASGGINKAGLGRGVFSLFQSQPGQSNSLSHNIVRAIHEDRSGDLWIGTAAGLDRYDLLNNQFTHYSNIETGLDDDFILSIYEDQRGTIWIGTLQGGLSKFDPSTKQITNYQHHFRDPLSLSDNTVRVIFEDQQGVLWVGTNHGLNRFDHQSGLFNSYIYFKDVGSTTIRVIYEDRLGTLWVGTDTGLFWLDRSSNRFFSAHSADHPRGMSADLVLSLFEDRSGNLWIGTFQGGLNRYDRYTQTIQHYRKNDGLPSDVIYGILADDEGNLWLSTGRGLARFDPQAETFTSFGIADGLQNREFSEGAYHKGSNGHLYFGGVSGLTVFDPADIKQNTYTPNLVLTSLSQGGELLDLDQPVDQVDAIILSWPKNFFEFEFAALSYQHSEGNQYAYILEGFEDQWNTIGTNRFGRYTNLPGGSYTLRIIGSNNDGFWNENGTSIDITIVPPFWETWWFLLGLGILIAGGILGGYRWRVMTVETRSRELGELVRTRTAELSEANLRLRAEIGEREKVEDRLAQRAVEAAVEEERNRLARDLHDAVTQTLFSASLIAEVLPRLWRKDRTEGQRRLDELRELTRGALAEMRTLLLELRPAALIEAELGELLNQLAESITGRARIPVTLRQAGQCDLPSGVKIALYRIAQEALNNVAKHAPTSQAEIHLHCQPNQVVLSIVDDGPGFDPVNLPPESLGLGIMKERAEVIGAELKINNQAGQGTVVEVIWHNH